jgi:hypothetical protein
MKIVIGNLPDDSTEEGLRDALSGIVEVGSILLLNESGTPSAVIEMNITRVQADALAKRIHGRIYKGRDLRAWVPLEHS